MPSRPTTDTFTVIPSGKLTILQMTHESGKYSPSTPSSSAERSCWALSSTSEEWPSRPVRESASSASQMALLPTGDNSSLNAPVISGNPTADKTRHTVRYRTEAFQGRTYCSRCESLPIIGLSAACFSGGEVAPSPSLLVPRKSRRKSGNRRSRRPSTRCKEDRSRSWGTPPRLGGQHDVLSRTGDQGCLRISSANIVKQNLARLLSVGLPAKTFRQRHRLGQEANSWIESTEPGGKDGRNVGDEGQGWFPNLPCQ